MSSFEPTQAASAWLSQIGEWISRILRGAGVYALLGRLRRRRVPVLLQLNTVECGAACLAMILSYYGRRTSVAQCREHCAAGRGGATAQTIARAAERYGLRVRAYSAEPADLRYIRLPAIVHWQFKHFVVVERWSPRQVVIVDPGAGRRWLDTAAFDAGFTGVVLTFEPGAQFERRGAIAQPSRRAYLRSMLYERGAGGVLAQALAASLVVQVLGLALPLFTQVLVDRILPFRVAGLMTVLGIGMLLLILAQAVVGYLRTALLIYVRARLDSRMMLGFFEHLLALPFRFFQQRTRGDLLMRLESHVQLRETLTSQTLSIVLDGVFVLVYLAILLGRDPFFGLLVLGAGLLQVALMLGTVRPLRTLADADLAAQADSQGYLVEALSGIATLKASGAEARTLDHWSNLFFTQLNISLRRSSLSALVNTATTAVRSLSPLLFLWVGAWRVLDGTLSLGEMLALNALAMAFLTPFTSLASAGQQLQLVGAYLDRIADVAEAEPEQQPHNVEPAPLLSGRIAVEHVSFRYDSDSPPVLHGVSFRVEPGQKVALVGATGSGKSTLALLLLGLYVPDAGAIRYDGVPLQRLDYRTLRSQCGVVLQEPFLFSGSIRQNIAFNNPDLSLDEVIEAARKAAIHHEIMRMPMGYETLVAEGGSALSGGQRQRLTIARALAHRPAVLVLDEATSHLDALTEQIVDEHLNACACTRIVIAHRLSTIRNADLILVLDRGAIVEQGTHEELLGREGSYAALVRSQVTTSVGVEKERRSLPSTEDVRGLRPDRGGLLT